MPLFSKLLQLLRCSLARSIFNGLTRQAQAEHTNVGEFLKPDTKWTAIWLLQRASFAIVKTAFNATPGAWPNGLCARCCSRAAQVTANRLSRVRLLSQCPIPDKKWNEIIILIGCWGEGVWFVFTLALSGCSSSRK